MNRLGPEVEKRVKRMENRVERVSHILLCMDGYWGHRLECCPTPFGYIVITNIFEVDIQNTTMNGLNKATLIGNLGKDPVSQILEGGIHLAKFTLATSESYKDEKGIRHTETEWHNIIAWRGLAEVATKYLKKGSSVYIEGKIKTRSYEDKAGAKKYVTEIIADNLIMLDKAEMANDLPPAVARKNIELDTDLPF